MKPLYFQICLILLCFHAEGKILILTQAYNRTDFIEMQKATFDAFLEDDDFEYVVFNDAIDETNKNNIDDVCKKNGIRCFRVPQEIHDWPYLAPGDLNGSRRNTNVVQFSLDTIGFRHNDIVFAIDNDLVLIKKFSIRKFMENTDFAGRLMPHKYPYFWIGMLFMDMRTLPNRHTINVDCSTIYGTWTDSGGWTYNYLHDNPKIHTKYVDLIQTINLICHSCKNSGQFHVFCSHNRKELLARGFNTDEIELIQNCPMHRQNPYVNLEFLLNKTFLHYGGSSGHGASKFLDQTGKINALQNFIKKILTNEAQAEAKV